MSKRLGLNAFQKTAARGGRGWEKARHPFAK
jgi:hypothetical protein